MYACSDAFHAAVANNNPQMALFIFDDCVITNEDIDIDMGVELTDYFCTTEDIGIGEALSNELRFKLMNEKQLLNDFPFGEFTALLGVQISEASYGGGLSLSYGGHTFAGGAVSGKRLTKDGVATANQPPFSVVSMAAVNNKVYCFSERGQIYAVYAGTGKTAPLTSYDFMVEKASRWGGCTYSYENRILTIRIIDVNGEGFELKYEFVPLGIFTAERPAVVDDVQLDMTCYDRMKKFDADMDVDVNYPTSLLELLRQVCRSEGVELETTSFINASLTVAEKPDKFDRCTKRDVIAWIAEAAGSNAKISRDGMLRLAWLQSTSQSFDESTYTECRPFYYTTPAVNKLVVRDLGAGSDTNVGSGDNPYLIQDNPFL